MSGMTIPDDRTLYMLLKMPDPAQKTGWLEHAGATLDLAEAEAWANESPTHFVDSVTPERRGISPT